MTNTWQGKIALVTGASSGIGAATARRLAKEGLLVILVARRVRRLEQLAAEIIAGGGQAEVISADLGLEEDRQRVYDTVNSRHGCPDVLINDAGFSYYGYLVDMPWQTGLDMLAVNVVAAIHLTYLFLPEMLARRSGHIITIGSINGGFPNQGTAMYSGTKGFLDSFCTALHRELRGSGVHIGEIRPGPVATELYDVSESIENGRRIPMENAAIPSEAVAETVWGMLRRPKRIRYVPGYLAVLPLIEFSFGWLIDLIGPALLKRDHRA